MNEIDVWLANLELEAEVWARKLMQEMEGNNGLSQSEQLQQFSINNPATETNQPSAQPNQLSGQAGGGLAQNIGQYGSGLPAASSSQPQY